MAVPWLYFNLTKLNPAQRRLALRQRVKLTHPRLGASFPRRFFELVSIVVMVFVSV
jgi:hypothetical protein